MSNLEPSKVVIVGTHTPGEPILQELLGMGLSPVLAASPDQAILKSQYGDIALIVFDSSVRGDDALAAARSLRAATPAEAAVPILFLMPLEWDDKLISEASALGGVDFLWPSVLPQVFKARVAMCLDLSRARRSLEKIKQQATDDRSFLAAVLDSIEDAIVACDSKGTLTVFNRASKDLHGLPEEDIPREEWSAHYSLYRPDGVTPLPVAEIPLVRALNGDLVRGAEMVIKQNDGSPRLLSASGRALVNADGQPYGAVVSMHDVTASREVQVAREARIFEQAGRAEAEAAAAAILENTERFALLLNSSAEGIYGMGPDSTCIFLNNAGAQMLGYQVAELVGRPIHDVIHHHRPDGRHYPQSECKIAIAARAGAFVRVEDEVFWHKDGTAVPVSYSVNPMLVAGRNAGAVITFTDVTERRRASEALRASNERAHLAADAGGLGLFTWDLASDTVIWHNDIPYEIFGLPREEAPLNAARFAAQFLHPDDAEAFSAAMAAAVERGEPFHFEGRIHRLPDSAVRWVEFTGRSQATADQPLRVIGTAADVTFRKEADQALRDSEERLRQLANTIPNLAWMADADGWISWYNDRWFAYTGTTPNEMEGWGWQSVHDPETLPQVMAQWTSSIRTGQPFEMTFPLRGSDGLFRPFFTLVAPLRDAQGQVIQWFGTNTDVSPLKHAEEQLRDADRRKDEFLAMLAHELRNPLAPIRNAAEILRRLDSPDPSIHRISEIIARQVAHMAGLLNDLLDVSRVTRGAITLDRERVDLASAIANAVEQVRPLLEQKNHRLSLENCHLGTYVFASPLRLTQVIANLLDNAAKYSPHGGCISVDVQASGSEVRIVVSDTGVGISAHLLPHVFEPFSQAERTADRTQGGLGLGLAVVKGLVELHGGSVSAESEGAGKGSRFVVVLPMYKAPPPVDMVAHEADRTLPLGGALEVLLVDDNVDAGESLSILLQTYGHRTTLAHSGSQALEAVRSQRFDAVFLDIGLPDITGYEVAQNIGNSVSPVPVLIALTGYGQAEDVSAAMDAGIAKHMVKPVDPEALIQFLQTIPQGLGKS